jgi:hypothetical protein
MSPRVCTAQSTGSRSCILRSTPRFLECDNDTSSFGRWNQRGTGSRSHYEEHTDRPDLCLCVWPSHGVTRECHRPANDVAVSRHSSVRAQEIMSTVEAATGAAPMPGAVPMESSGAPAAAATVRQTATARICIYMSGHLIDWHASTIAPRTTPCVCSEHSSISAQYACVRRTSKPL